MSQNKRTEAKQTVLVEYDKLIQNYWDALNVKLRGFIASDKINFLSSWVPVENDLKNFVNILTNASEADVDNVTFRFSMNTFLKIGEEELIGLGSNLIEVDILKKGRYVDFVVSGLTNANLAHLRKMPHVEMPKIAKRKTSQNVESIYSIDENKKRIERSSEDAIHPIYSEKLVNLAKSPVHNKVLTKKKGLAFFEVANSGIMLSALIDPLNHLVVT